MTLVDSFGRTVNYLRLSVTDRCDFRCVYCMAEEMTFIPKAQLLTIEEMTQISAAFVHLGVSKIRITGGEPLVRRNIQQLFSNLGKLDTLDELTLTTNGSQLEEHIESLVASGVRRINVSLDSLKADRFADITRTGKLHKVLSGIQSAIDAGLRVKLNTVILKNRNADEVLDLVNFALDKQVDISFIEEMPLGTINEHARDEEYISSAELRRLIEQKYSLEAMHPTNHSTNHPTKDHRDNHRNSTAGPSKYWQVAGYPSKIGFISPHSDNFCASCNRVRLTATGQLLLCLGNEHSVDLRAVVRHHPNNPEKLQQTIIDAMSIKPEKHDFQLDEEPQILRFMNMTGG